MKNHNHVIRLIILTAALVAAGVFAFKYTRSQKSNAMKVHCMQDAAGAQCQCGKNNVETQCMKN